MVQRLASRPRGAGSLLEKIMKIALSGSGSTGKTTLAYEFGKRFGVPVIPEYARETAQEMGIVEIRNMSPDQSYDFQRRILDRKINEELKYNSFIADRCTADNIAYYLRWCCRDIDDERNQEYIELCREHLETYDKIVFLPWKSISLENDGFRSSKIYYQFEIHCLIFGILNQYHAPFMIYSDSDLEDRINLLKSIFGL